MDQEIIEMFEDLMENQCYDKEMAIEEVAAEFGEDERYIEDIIDDYFGEDYW